MPSSEFVFVLCQPGAERALKAELARHHPELAPAFQRPGLVTLRSPRPLGPELALHTAFARVAGVSLGNAPDHDGVFARIADVSELLVLHVSERPASARDTSFTPYPASPAAVALRTSLLARAPERFQTRERAEPGDLVLCVSFAGDEPLLVGLHRRRAEHSPYPGGVPPIQLPADAPSRAYAKIEEAIERFGLAVRPGDHALELGAAPGGACYALLRRGVHVVGVDPGEMDPHVLAFQGPGGARLVHYPFKASALSAAHLRAPVQHLLCDVHLAPPVALRALRKALSLVRGDVRSVVWTVKLNDWSMADALDGYVAELRALGVCDARAVQLVANRQEVCIAGRMR
jgi:23S rRNA (cytidine2498-2'-O)-methyltransferase